MNKLTILVFSLTLFACANRTDTRPEIYSRGEYLLSNGIVNYKKDKFSAAQQDFYRALMLYQSVDNSNGVQLARINLLESLLALNNFDAAEEQLAFLKQKQVSAVLNESLKQRIILLEVKLLFKKQLYRESLATIEPLLLPLGQRGKNDNKQLELLATAARLEALIPLETEYRWGKQFREVLLQERNVQPKYQVTLKRINADIATRNQQYQEALKLLHEALAYYKDQPNRRAIAACLEEIAEIEIKQHNRPQALEYLNKALIIRVWLKDQYHINKIHNRMVLIN